MVISIFYQLIFYPLLVAVFYLLAIFDKKIKVGIKLKNQKLPAIKDTSTELYWFHVSSGEFEYAKPLIRELKNHKKCQILVTYFSPSVVSNIKNTPEVDYFCAAPWDFSWSVLKFIKHFKPKTLALARTDLWPMMLLQAKKHNIQTILFSATLASHSPRVASFFGRMFYSLVIENLNHISCVTQEDADNFKKTLPSASISVDGDTRYDQVFYRLQNTKINLDINNIFKNKKPVFIAGSTWPEDEEILVPALSPHFFNILVPHEIHAEHIKNLKDKLIKCNLTYVTYSELIQNTFSQTNLNNTHVLIVDQVGILASLYSICELAFVGGSFKKSVHSVMEAAASGCFTLVGPYHYNNREALMLKQKGFLKELNQSQDFKLFFQSFQNTQKQNIIDFCKSQTGVSKKLLNHFH